MIDKHRGLYRGRPPRPESQIICLQEIFYGPYFCAEQQTRWYDFTEPIPDGPTMRADAGPGEAAPHGADRADLRERAGGRLLQHRRRDRRRRRRISANIARRISRTCSGLLGEVLFPAGNLGYPVFDLGFAQIGVYICYDRHFPEGARALGLNGAEIVFNPSATVAGLSEYLWKLEQPAHAVANGYFIGAINRVGTEAPWNIGEFYGSVISAIRAGRSSRKPRAIKTKC